MKLHRLKKLSMLVLVACLSGCATWTVVGGNHVSSDHAFEVEIPPDWRRYMLDREAVLITRNGMALQSIRMGRLPFDKDPPHTKRKLAKGMLPEEVAEVVLDDFRSNRALINFQMIENAPSAVGGYAGFRLSYTYQTQENLKKQGIYYGVLVDQWFYFLLFQAPARHYFGRDLTTFEKMKQSFRITL